MSAWPNMWTPTTPPHRSLNGSACALVALTCDWIVAFPFFVLFFPVNNQSEAHCFPLHLGSGSCHVVTKRRAEWQNLVCLSFQAFQPLGIVLLLSARIFLLTLLRKSIQSLLYFSETTILMCVYITIEEVLQSKCKTALESWALLLSQEHQNNCGFHKPTSAIVHVFCCGSPFVCVTGLMTDCVGIVSLSVRYSPVRDLSSSLSELSLRAGR